MSSKTECTTDEMVRNEVRQHFMGTVKNPQLQEKIRQTYKPVEHCQTLNEQALKTRQKLQESKTAKLRNFQQDPTSGGDADRMLFYTTHDAQHDGDYCGMPINNNISLRHLRTNSKPSAPAIKSNSIKSSLKYQTIPTVDNYFGSYPFFYENDSNLDGLCNGSDDSAKSQKSSKTVVSLKSSQDLRKLVASQCKLHEVIGETIKVMCNTERENTVENVCGLQGDSSTHYNLPMSPCKGCNGRLRTVQSQKDVTTEIGKGDLLDCRNNNTLTISVDDVINSRVINPMIHKLHRMYLNNLKEEMSIMEDLERLPNKVNDIYKSIIFKQKD